MRRDQLEHAIRTACQIIGMREVIVVGSQSILGTFREDQLPAAATMSADAGILPPSPMTTTRLRASPTSSKEWPASSPRSRNSTASASTASTLKLLPCQPAGATGSSRSRTPTPQLRAGNRSTPAGASTRKTCASPSSAPSGKRTRTSSQPSSGPHSSTARPSSLGQPQRPPRPGRLGIAAGLGRTARSPPFWLPGPRDPSSAPAPPRAGSRSSEAAQHTHRGTGLTPRHRPGAFHARSAAHGRGPSRYARAIAYRCSMWPSAMLHPWQEQIEVILRQSVAGYPVLPFGLLAGLG